MMDAITPCSFLNQISGLYLQKRIPGITFLGLTYYVEDLAHAVKFLSVTEDRDKAQILGNEVDAKFKHLREEVGKLPELSECILDEQEFKSFVDIRSCTTYCFNTLPNVKYRTGNNVSVVTYDDISGARYAVDALLPKSRTDTFKREWGQAHVDFAAMIEDELELIHNFIDNMQVSSKRSDTNTQAGNRDANTQAVMNIEPMSTPDERKDATLNTGDTIERRVVNERDQQMQREAMEAAPAGLPTWAIILIVIVVIAVVAAIVTVVIRKNKKKELVESKPVHTTPPAVGASPYAMPSISTGPHAAYYGYGGGMNLYRGRNDLVGYDDVEDTSDDPYTEVNPNVYGLNQMPSDMAAKVYRIGGNPGATRAGLTARPLTATSLLSPKPSY